MLELKGTKRAEEKAKESWEAKDESYEDDPWTELCKDVTKLQKLCSRAKQLLKPPKAEAAFEEEQE